MTVPPVRTLFVYVRCNRWRNVQHISPRIPKFLWPGRNVYWLWLELRQDRLLYGTSASLVSTWNISVRSSYALYTTQYTHTCTQTHTHLHIHLHLHIYMNIYICLCTIHRHTYAHLQRCTHVKTTCPWSVIWLLWDCCGTHGLE